MKHLFGLCVVGAFLMAGCSSSTDEINNNFNGEPYETNTPMPSPTILPTTQPTDNTSSTSDEGLFQTILNEHDFEIAPLIATNWGDNDLTSITAAAGANDFAFMLSSALLEVEEIATQNFVVSPYSVWLPLAALVNATDVLYRDAFIESLGALGINVNDLNRAASRMLFDLTNESHRRGAWADPNASSPLHIANAIFVGYNYSQQQNFARTFIDYFRGETINVDFRSTTAVDVINAWANENTNGRISRVVEEIDEDAVAAIANAIYFSDRWMTTFNAELTERGIFNSPTGSVDAYFMQRTGLFSSYFENEYLQAIDLAFSSGGMTILLPKNGDAVGLLSSMTNEQFNYITTNFVFADGTLVLPRFYARNTLENLTEALSMLGMDFLFCEVTAPLDGLIYHPFPLYISDAVQVAMVEVHEEGATAAAVTVMVAIPMSGSPPPQMTFEMVCDTPFVFILHGRTIDGGRQVLFTGVVNQP